MAVNSIKNNLNSAPSITHLAQIKEEIIQLYLIRLWSFGKLTINCLLCEPSETIQSTALILTQPGLLCKRPQRRSIKLLKVQFVK
jgi:hypothetical protein